MVIVKKIYLVLNLLQTLAVAGGAKPPSSYAFTIGQVVQTTSGLISGKPATHSPAVSEYLGIPFAIPPVGSLRWARPQPFVGKGIINATSFSPDCPSMKGDLGALPGLPSEAAVRLLTALSQFGDEYSEDCLTLNVWTKPQTGEKAKAVLVWIYGGAFSEGATNVPIYYGEHIANNQDVIVVSINYRVNIFGFPGLPGMDQNLGLLDQRLAIEWVQQNIAAFGGDPSRITIFGQSAGGASVDYYAYAWTENPIVAGLIEQSGTATSFLSYSASLPNNTAMWYNVTEQLGCGGPSAGIQSTLSCMRGKDFPSIVNALGSNMFAATIDNKIIFSDYPARATAGNFIKKPYLIGNADNEAGLFRLLEPSAPDSVWPIVNLGFTCPARDAAQARASNNVPIWRYRWFGDFYNTRISDNPDSGAYHTSELPIIFGTAEDITRSPNSLAEAAITTYLQGAWATFAKNPTSGLSSGPYSWPRYGSTSNSLVRIAFENQTTASYVSPDTYDSACGTYGVHSLT